ncbi:MAG: succinate--CoA ligase subunit alpha [Fimbriimonadales bacterium]|nr:succinate--CoA ligase subunit alpha [Fimbriimonadales bacterium]
MAILVDQTTRVLVQGITGREGSFHAREMRAYGTNVVAGVTPGKGGQKLDGIPVFDTVEEAVRETGATASVIFVPAPFCADAILESEAAGIPLICAITEGVPQRDMLAVMARLGERGRSRLVGPNCPGVISPERCKIGIMPGYVFRRGPVGVVSRSGTLTYEIVQMLSRSGLGQSTCVGVGGDPILGTRFIDVLPMFEQDPETEAVVLIGEIGGDDEEVAARYIAGMSKPVVAFISGRTAPPGKRMGHAGAIISGGMGTAESKVRALTEAGALVAETLGEIPDLLRSRLSGAPKRGGN